MPGARAAALAVTATGGLVTLAWLPIAPDTVATAHRAPLPWPRFSLGLALFLPAALAANLALPVTANTRFRLGFRHNGVESPAPALRFVFAGMGYAAPVAAASAALPALVLLYTAWRPAADRTRT